MRLDKFLKVSRIIKRRTVAKEACDKGIVTINGKVAKSSSEVNVGDTLEIQFGEIDFQIVNLYSTIELISIQEHILLMMILYLLLIQHYSMRFLKK